MLCSTWYLVAIFLWMSKADFPAKQRHLVVQSTSTISSSQKMTNQSLKVFLARPLLMIELSESSCSLLLKVRSLSWLRQDTGHLPELLTESSCYCCSRFVLLSRVLLNCGLQTAELVEPPEPILFSKQTEEKVFF